MSLITAPIACPEDGNYLDASPLEIHPGDRPVITALSVCSRAVESKSEAVTTVTAAYPTSRNGVCSSASLSRSLSSPVQRVVFPSSSTVHLAESEKLLKIRRRKEKKEIRKIKKVFEYQTEGDDKNYNVDAVVESFVEKDNANKKSSKEKKSNKVKLKNGRKTNVSSNNNNASSDDKDDDDDDTDSSEDKLSSSSSLVHREDDNNNNNEYFNKALSKSTENLTQYSSENLNSFTKVTNKKQKWKKNYESDRKQQQYGYNGYNLRNREITNSENNNNNVTNKDIGLNATDFPPLGNEQPDDSSSSSFVSANNSWSKAAASSSSTSSFSSSSSVVTSVGDPDTVVPDLPGDKPAVEIALTEEEYRRKGNSAPVVIFGRSSSAVRDWTSSENSLEFGFEVNESLLAMSADSLPPVSSSLRQDGLPPLDAVDGAILSFGDSVVTDLLAPEFSLTTPEEETIPTREEDVTYNYKEIIKLLEASWLQTENELKQKPQTVRYHSPSMSSVVH